MSWALIDEVFVSSLWNDLATPRPLRHVASFYRRSERDGKTLCVFRFVFILEHCSVHTVFFIIFEPRREAALFAFQCLQWNFSTTDWLNTSSACESVATQARLRNSVAFEINVFCSCASNLSSWVSRHRNVGIPWMLRIRPCILEILETSLKEPEFCMISDFGTVLGGV